MYVDGAYLLFNPNPHYIWVSQLQSLMVEEAVKEENCKKNIFSLGFFSILQVIWLNFSICTLFYVKYALKSKTVTPYTVWPSRGSEYCCKKVKIISSLGILSILQVILLKFSTYLYTMLCQISTKVEQCDPYTVWPLGGSEYCCIEEKVLRCSYPHKLWDPRMTLSNPRPPTLNKMMLLGVFCSHSVYRKRIEFVTTYSESSFPAGSGHMFNFCLARF